MSTPASTSGSMAPTLWADLPPDLLGDVSGRLHDPVDFTRFHAVCTAWRYSLTTTARRPKLLPGLLTLTACKGHVLHSSVKFSPERTKRRLSYYRRSCRDILLAKPPGASPASKNWVASANGTDAWLLMTTDAGSGLLNLLTGAFTPLPAYNTNMRRMKNPHGTVYADGTVFLYSFAYESSSRLAFMAAILRPGDATWTPVKTMLHFTTYIAGCFGRVAAAYHDGKILLCVNLNYWCILTPDDDGGGASLKLQQTTWWYGTRGHRSGSYIFEFQGQLLWVSVLVRVVEADPARGVSLVVHALEQDKMRWVMRDVRSMADHVLFLGSRSSFFMDAAVLGGDGGCAYFLFGNDVLMYSFVNDETKLVERIDDPDWPIDEAQNMHWLQPQPAIAPIQDIRQRLGGFNLV